MRVIWDLRNCDPQVLTVWVDARRAGGRAHERKVGKEGGEESFGGELHDGQVLVPSMRWLVFVGLDEMGWVE